MIPGQGGIVVQNRWREAATDLGDNWLPSKTVSIVVPAYNNAAGLDLVLASLAAQDYPQDLIEVTVIDDGSEPALSLPEIRPPNTRLLRAQNGWGRANAVHEGIARSEGEILLQLDSDLIVDRGHVTSHLLVHDQFVWAAAKGNILFVNSWPDDPRLIMEAVRDDQLANVFHETTKESQWVENFYAKTDDLNNGGDLTFSILTGATCSMPRSLYELAGGMRTDLRLGEDTDLAYRIAQRGAVFVPCLEAKSFHLGLSNTHLRSNDVGTYNRPFFAQNVPQAPRLKKSTGRQWSVPLLRVVVDIDAETAQYARACVDRVLSSTFEDLAVDLIGPWDDLHADRRKVLSDPMRELYATAEWYRGESRVCLLSERPSSAFPSAYEMAIPVEQGVQRTTIERLVRTIIADRAGEHNARAPAGGLVTIWRTAAVERAARFWGYESARQRAGDVWGDKSITPDWLHLDDLSVPSKRKERIAWTRNHAKSRRLRAELDEARGRQQRSALRRVTTGLRNRLTNG